MVFFPLSTVQHRPCLLQSKPSEEESIVAPIHQVKGSARAAASLLDASLVKVLQPVLNATHSCPSCLGVLSLFILNTDGGINHATLFVEEWDAT